MGREDGDDHGRRHIHSISHGRDNERRKARRRPRLAVGVEHHLLVRQRKAQIGTGVRPVGIGHRPPLWRKPFAQCGLRHRKAEDRTHLNNGAEETFVTMNGFGHRKIPNQNSATRKYRAASGEF
jgi:hypothetical protein